MPVIIEIKVVFPAPLGPKRPKVSFDAIARLKLRTAG